MKKILLILLLGLLPMPAAAQQASGSATLNVNPLIIQVSGNKLVDGSGHTIQLEGAVVPLPQCDTPIRQIVPPMATWYFNAVRLAMDEECWLGINGETGRSQATSISYIQQLEANGMYVIIGIAYSAPGNLPASSGQPMPNAHTIDFWTSIAAAFKNDRAVIFNPWGEVYGPVDWNCWLNGGCTVTSNEGVNYTAVGMQALVNAVRNAGAVQQPIMLTGLNFSTDLSQFVANKPNDPSNAIAASITVYDTYGCDTSCLAAQINPVIAAGIPVTIGEFGEFDCAHGFIDGVMSWADGFSPPLSYFAWAWNTSQGCMALTSNYATGVTGGVYGTGFKAHLGGTR